MAAAAILDFGFYLETSKDIVLFHRSMACDISNILDFYQLSEWNGQKCIFMHDLGFLEVKGQKIGKSNSENSQL